MRQTIFGLVLALVASSVNPAFAASVPTYAASFFPGTSTPPCSIVTAQAYITATFPRDWPNPGQNPVIVYYKFYSSHTPASQQITQELTLTIGQPQNIVRTNYRTDQPGTSTGQIVLEIVSAENLRTHAKLPVNGSASRLVTSYTCSNGTSNAGRGTTGGGGGTTGGGAGGSAGGGGTVSAAEAAQFDVVPQHVGPAGVDIPCNSPNPLLAPKSATANATISIVKWPADWPGGTTVYVPYHWQHAGFPKGPTLTAAITSPKRLGSAPLGAVTVNAAPFEFDPRPNGQIALDIDPPFRGQEGQVFKLDCPGWPNGLPPR